MIALDTCVLARFIIGDDPAQQEAAASFVADNRCSVSWSVLIELCWVLESSARLPRQQVAAGLAMLREIEGVVVPDDGLFAWAVDRYARGADFSDMVHLASAIAGTTTLATFDRKLRRQAGASAPLDIVTIPS